MNGLEVYVLRQEKVEACVRFVQPAGGHGARLATADMRLSTSRRVMEQGRMILTSIPLESAMVGAPLVAAALLTP